MRAYRRLTEQEWFALVERGWTVVSTVRWILEASPGQGGEPVTGVELAEEPIEDDVQCGPVVAMIEVDQDLFERWVHHNDRRARVAHVPVEILDQIGRPVLYDHTFAGSSRRDMVYAIWGLAEDTRPEALDQLREMQSAFSFMDAVGWRSFVTIRELQL